MKWELFWIVTICGWGAILVQAMCSLADNCLTQAQLRDGRGIYHGYALVEHGGIRYDILISAEVGYLVSRYDLGLGSEWSAFTLGLCGILWIVADVMMFQPAGKITPEAHTLSPGARWTHLVFAILATWINVRFYFTAVVPPPSLVELLAVSVVLTPFFYMGIKKFNPQWKFGAGDRGYVAFMTVGLWVLTGIKLSV